METKIFTQPKQFNGTDYSIGDHLEQLMLSKRPKYTDLSLFFGLVKENAYEKIYPSLKSFIMNNGNIKFYLSYDKKGASKKIITSLLELGCEVYVFTGNDKDFITDFQYKTVIFSSDKKATILLSTGNFSLSGLYEGHNAITQFSFDLKTDKTDFNNMLETLLPEYTMCLFKKVNHENLNDLVKSTEKSIPSIEEFTRKDVDQSSPIETSTDDFSIDIEIDQNVDFLVAPTEVPDKPKKEKNANVKSVNQAVLEPIEAIDFGEPKYYLGDDVAEALDIENMLFETSSNSLKFSLVEETPTEEKTYEEEVEETSQTKIIAKSTNLSKTSIFMMQLPKIAQRGASKGEIKIPVYLRDLISSFWGWPKEYSVAKNSIEKSRICTFKIIDTKNADITITDENVKLFQREGESSFIILSEKLEELELNENDIIRFIKTESATGSYYTCEIVRTDAKEYPIWEQFCTNVLKGSKRKYGLM